MLYYPGSDKIIRTENRAHQGQVVGKGVDSEKGIYKETQNDGAVLDPHGNGYMTISIHQNSQNFTTSNTEFFACKLKSE